MICRMEALYNQLPGHGDVIQDFVAIRILQGPLDREQMAALACVAEHYGVEYELLYTKDPADCT